MKMLYPAIAPVDGVVAQALAVAGGRKRTLVFDGV